MAIGEHAIAVTPFVNGVPNPNYQNTDAGAGFYDETFKRYINEVRVRNVARTQDQIKHT